MFKNHLRILRFPFVFIFAFLLINAIIKPIPIIFSVTADADDTRHTVQGSHTITYNEFIGGGGPPLGYYLVYTESEGGNQQYLTYVYKNNVELFHGTFGGATNLQEVITATTGDVIKITVKALWENYNGTGTVNFTFD